MKKIFSIYIYVILLTTSLNAEITSFGTIGYSENYSPTATDYYSLNFGAGYKYKDSKLYFFLDTLTYTKGSKDISLILYSIDYDHIYYRTSDFMFYGGVGINILEVIDILDTKTNVEENIELNEISGGTIKTGFAYSVSEKLSIDVGIKYLYMNTNISQELVSNTYGTYLNLQYDFFTFD